MSARTIGASVYDSCGGKPTPFQRVDNYLTTLRWVVDGNNCPFVIPAGNALMSARHDSPVILYVEDQETDALLMRRAFRQASTWRLQTVTNGREAIAYLTGAPPYSDRAMFPQPDMVLLDLDLPFLSGFEVLAAIRLEPDFANLPVVVFSGSVRADDRSRARALGANGYILKPNSGDGFSQTVSELHSFYERCDRVAVVEARRGSIIRI